MRTEYNNYASQALEKAAQDAASCHQKYIGTEHLILGLLAQPDSLSGRVLYENGLNYENFLEAVLGESAALGDNANQTFLGYSPKAEHVLLTSEEEAIRLTRQYYTEPGHSEHHSGLAFDIITVEYQRDVYSLTEQFAETDAYRWLTEHCAEYGFILRYPEGKTDITQINYEPWHYRYVGKEHAQYIMEHNLTFEEYIELLREAGR